MRVFVSIISQLQAGYAEEIRQAKAYAERFFDLSKKTTEGNTPRGLVEGAFDDKAEKIRRMSFEYRIDEAYESSHELRAPPKMYMTETFHAKAPARAP